MVVRDLSTGSGLSPYRSPKRYEFQAEFAARAYVAHDFALSLDEGLGKTHITFQLGALLFEDDLIDTMVIVTESAAGVKLQEWKEDLAEFWNMPYGLYLGGKRQQLLEEEHGTMLMTYETARSDAVIKEGSRRKPGPLTRYLMGKRVLFAFDEISKLKTRTSESHRSIDRMVREVRKAADARVLGMSATWIEGSPEDFYNSGRIVIPYQIGTVAQFEHDHVAAKNFHGKPSKFKNLSPPADEPNVTTFVEKWGDHLGRKRKTDEDVRHLFPEPIEEFRTVAMSPDHRELYEAVQEEFREEILASDPRIWGVLRGIAAHPMSVVGSESALAKRVVHVVGEDVLRAIGSSRIPYLKAYYDTIVNKQGAQVLLFEYLGQIALPHIYNDLKEDFSCAIVHSKMTTVQKREARAAFKSGEARILLLSDASKRGINMPEASYITHHSPPTMFSTYRQRIGRGSRIGQGGETIVSRCLIAAGTVEEGIFTLNIKRNTWDEKTLDWDATDEDDTGATRITAALRRRLMQISSKNPWTEEAAA